MQDVIENWDGKLPSTLLADGENSIFKMFAVNPSQITEETAGAAADQAVEGQN
jgi:hypothetical protein